jgi:dethiobiotin synthetase
MEEILARRPSDKEMVIEGAGGLLVPLNEKDLMIDLIAALGTPVVLVTRSGLGTINHTLLSLEALKARSIPLLGVVMVGPSNRSNRQAIAFYGGVRILGEIPHLETLDRTSLIEAGRHLHLPWRENHDPDRSVTKNLQ